MLYVISLVSFNGLPGTVRASNYSCLMILTQRLLALWQQISQPYKLTINHIWQQVLVHIHFQLFVQKHCSRPSSKD